VGQQKRLGPVGEQEAQGIRGRFGRISGKLGEVAEALELSRGHTGISIQLRTDGV
jgi:hypothetical protein